MLLRATPFLAIALASAAACGGDRGGPIPLDELADLYAAIACASMFRCCDAGERPFREEALCNSEVSELMQDWIDELGPSLAAGHVAYDGEGAASCLDALSAAACTEVEVTAGSCILFVGQVALGGACDDRDECAGGNFCDAHACVAPPGPGDLCIGEDCGDGAYCYTRTPMDPPGPLYTCRALEAAGAACTSSYQCASEYCDLDADLCAPEPVSTRCDGV